MGLLEGRDRAGRFFPLREVVGEILDNGDFDQALDDLMARYLRHVGGRVTDDMAILAALHSLRLPTPDQFIAAH